MALTQEQQNRYFATEGKKATPLSPDEWAKGQGSLPDLTPDRNLDNPEKTLPERNTGRLLQFTQAMQDAVSLAKKKREEFGLQFLGNNFKAGEVNPSDFSSLVSRFGNAGEQFAQNTISPAINLFSKSIDDINNIGMTASENGASDDIVSDILSSESVGEAITKSKGFLKKKEKGAGDVQITEEEVLPDDVPTLDEYIKAAEELARQSLGPAARERIKQQYDAEFGGKKIKKTSTNIKFSEAQLLKLEAKGLLKAPRQEQLNALYSADEEYDKY